MRATSVDSAPRRTEWSAGAAAGLALLAEGTLVALVLERMAPVAAVFGGHVVVVALLAAATLAHRRAGGRSAPLFFLLVITTAVFGPLGAAGSVLVFLLRSVFPADERQSFEAWYRALFPEDEMEDERRLASLVDRAAGREGEVSIGPLFDILSHGTRTQKQIAIAVLTRGFNPAFAPALRMALRDPDNAIRVQAATSMTTIENNFMKRATVLEKAAQAAPDSPEALKALAQFHDEYAATGLLDPLRERRSRRTALDAYVKYLDMAPDDASARLAVARLLVRCKRYAAAASVLDRCMRDGLFTSHMAPWYMECLFHLRRFPELRRFARAHLADVAQLDRFPIRVVEMVRLWSGEGLAEKAA